MQCKTFERIDPETKELIYKPKKQFNTMDEAIEACKRLNMRPHRIHKLVSYKCKECCKYHIGRNGKEITDKYRRQNTIKASDHPLLSKKGFKVVGKINLDDL